VINKKLGKLLKTARATKPQWKLLPSVLLCPNIPKPLHGVAPRVILGSKWWDVTRRAAYASTGYHCQACGVHKYHARLHQWLEAHEEYDTDYLLGRMTYIRSVPLCHYCHAYIHSGRLQALRDKGQIKPQLHDEILSHGDRVLRQAGLTKPPTHNGPMADWSDWRLVLNDKLYPPKFKTVEEWEKEFA